MVVAGATAAVAHGLQLVHELGVRQEVGHRPEWEPPEVLVEPCDDHAHAVVGELEGLRDDRRLEELHFVDAHDVESLGALDDLGDARDRYSPHPRARVTHDVAAS